MPTITGDEAFEDAQVVFRNFAGIERQFNSAGDRNFCIVLDPERAADLERRGWNVKTLKGREDGDEDKRYIQVSVNYSKGRPPRVLLINSQGRMDLGADEVGMLDYADISRWDIIVNPYSWEVNDNKGIKAYLKRAFVTIDETEMERQYMQLPDANPTKTTSSSTASEEVA